MKKFSFWTDSCWDGYKQVGMKKKGNKKVPNCVPEDAPANAVAHGGVDMNPTGRARKMDRRMRYHPDAMFRRSKNILDGSIAKILKQRKNA